ncbi:MAG: hypothetical protein NTX57_14750 [Armatimonadetes bacterium]|nr:hypothetical protein [Armatimonadota bacterium]
MAHEKESIPLEEFVAIISGAAEAQLTKRQSTFLCVKAGEYHFRVTFRSKRAFHWPHKRFAGASFHTEHPLLLNYTDPQASLYFNAIPTDIPSLVQELEQVTQEVFGGWRPLWQYLNHYGTDSRKGFPIGGISRILEHLFRFPSGLFLRGPLSLAAPAQEILNRHGMQSALLADDAPTVTVPLGVLLLGNNVLIAESFWVEEEGG